MKHLTITMLEVPSLTSDDECKIISFFNKEIKRLKKDDDCLSSTSEIIEGIKQRIRKKFKENEDNVGFVFTLMNEFIGKFDECEEELFKNIINLITNLERSNCKNYHIKKKRR